MFAVIETGAKQYLVKTGDTLKIEKLGVAKGQEVVFDRVLLVANDDGTTVNLGAPYLAGVSIAATVLEEKKGKKIQTVKFKNKVRYKRTKGHRQTMTKVKMGEIK